MTRRSVLACATIVLASCSGGAMSTGSAADPPLTIADVGDGLDPKEFLCSFAGDADGRRDQRLSGRRFTPDERLRARERIAQEFARLGLTPVVHRYATEEYGTGTNLYVELPATGESDEWIVVGAHYDTVKTSPGADDDGSGVTAVILVAEKIKRLPERRANVLFAFFDQEELGCVGSAAFVEWAPRAQPAIKVAFAHCIDMIGHDRDGDRAVEIGNGRDEVAGGNGDLFLRTYKDAARRLGRSGEDIHQTGMGRSDHVSFLERGIPAALISEEFAGGDTTPHYHRPSDTCDTIDYAYLEATADLVAEAVAQQLKE